MQLSTYVDWRRDGDLAQRRYDSYEAYLEHQSQKLDRIEDRLRAREEEDLAIFLDRFEHCEALTGCRVVLCLGARIGTEVRALHQLGYFAVGLDLNPGRDNPLVLPGDFHALVFPDGSVDAVYTNCLDHVFDLEKMMSEVRRVLRPGGVFVADVLEGYEEGFVPGDYEATHWRKLEPFLDEVERVSGLTRESLRDPGRMREREKLRDRVHQAVFRKPDRPA